MERTKRSSKFCSETSEEKYSLSNTALLDYMTKDQQTCIWIWSLQCSENWGMLKRSLNCCQAVN